MISKLFKKFYYSFQIWKYSNKIPYLMMRKYGPAFSYSGVQIRSIISKWKFNKKYEHIAFAILSEEQEFNTALSGDKFKHSYFKIRQDIADRYFNGDKSFTICDLLSKSYFKAGAIHKSTCLPSEWKADRTFFECLHSCKEKQLFKLTNNDL
jgi:hypothetical protein